MLQKFGKEEELYALFKAQYEEERELTHGRLVSVHIALPHGNSALENSRIPNFYAPINEFVQRQYGLT